MSAVVAADVAQGIAELEEAFPGKMSHAPDGAGGAYITVGDLDLGQGWNTVDAPLTFHLPYNYPAAAPYPFYLPAAAAPSGEWPQALQRVVWRDEQVVQVSLRHNQWDPGRDTALGSVVQVRDWLRSI